MRRGVLRDVATPLSARQRQGPGVPRDPVLAKERDDAVLDLVAYASERVEVLALGVFELAVDHLLADEDGEGVFAAAQVTTRCDLSRIQGSLTLKSLDV